MCIRTYTHTPYLHTCIICAISITHIYDSSTTANCHLSL